MLKLNGFKNGRFINFFNIEVDFLFGGLKNEYLFSMKIYLDILEIIKRREIGVVIICNYLFISFIM